MAYKWKNDPKGYMNDYVRENVKYKRINFSANNPEDMEMFEWLTENYGSRKFSQYAKQLIKEDMEKQKKLVK